MIDAHAGDGAKLFSKLAKDHRDTPLIMDSLKVCSTNAWVHRARTHARIVFVIYTRENAFFETKRQQINF